MRRVGEEEPHLEHERSAESSHAGIVVERAPPVPMKVLSGELRSGIPLYVVEDVAPAFVSSVVCCLRFGARHDPPRRGGITHFLEHLLLRDRPDRPSFTRRINELGGEANGLTSKEELAIYARVPSDSLAQALTAAADCLTARELPLDELELERSVILEELEQAQGDPSDAIHDLAYESVFGRHTLARPPGGSLESVRAIGAPDILQLREERVHAGTIAICVAGGASLAEVSSLLDTTPLGEVGGNGWLPSAEPPPDLRALDASAPPQLRSIRSDYAFVALALPGFSYSDPREAAADVIGMLVAGSTSSLLYREVRERRGLAYALGGWHRPYTDTGFFRTTIGLTPQRASEVIEVSLETIAQQVAAGWTEAEVEIGKRQVVGEALLGLESSADSALAVARTRFVGDVEGWTPLEYTRTVAALTAGEVNELAADWLGDGLVTSGIGGFDGA